MRTLVTEGVALLLLIAAFPLISLGTAEGTRVLWGLGLACLVAGGLLPIATRFFGHGKEPDKARDCGMEYDDRTS
jgi:hypothetical protein